MLTIRDELRLWLKDLEFGMTPTAIRLIGKMGGLRDPYRIEDDELSAIFIHIPKSAGTSIRMALYGCKSFHVPAVRYKAFDQNKFENYFKFCFVRNPWSRLYSAYTYLHRVRDGNMRFPDHRWSASNLKQIGSFSEFVHSLEDKNICATIKKYIHFRDQLDWISEKTNGKRKICVDYIGKYESMAEDIEQVFSKINKKVELPRLRAQDKVDYRMHYTTNMIDIAEKIYVDDILQFNYSFE